MQTTSELRDLYRDEQLVLAVIDRTAMTYFESIIRRYKDENDKERAKEKDFTTKKTRRDARARQVYQVSVYQTLVS